MKNDYIKLFTDFLEKVEFLSDAECGRLVKALLLYKRDGQLPDIRGNEKILFPTFRAQIDRENEAYKTVCEKNSRNASMRWHASAYEIMPSDTKNAKNKEQRVKIKEDVDDDIRTRMGIAKVCECYEANMGAMPRIVGDDVAWYVGEGYEPELLCAAIEDAAMHNARSWGYVTKILQGCTQRGIKTVGAYLGEKAARKEQSKKSSSSNPFLDMVAAMEVQDK